MRDDCPQVVLRRKYAGAPFEWIFVGTFAERVHVFDPARLPRRLFWGEDLRAETPTAQRIIDTLRATLHVLESLMIDKDHNDLALYLYFDAHVPLACAFEDAAELTDETAVRLASEYAPDADDVLFEGTLPDVVGDLFKCPFWNESKSSKMDPIVHLLSKSLPQRCQIRNLNSIISNYCSEDDAVYEFMLRSVVCSILGNYAHARRRLSGLARMAVIRRWIVAPPNRTQTQEWLFSRHQHFLFYVIKECLTYIMTMDPVLLEAVTEAYKWESFRTCVHEAMDLARDNLDRRVPLTSHVVEWFVDIEPALLYVNKQQLGNLFRPQRLTFCQLALNICAKLDEDRHEPRLYVRLPRTYRDIIRAMLRRIDQTRTVPVEWLQYFNVPNDTVRRLIDMQKHYKHTSCRAELQKMFRSMDRMAFETVRELFQTFHEVHHNVRVYYLPQNMYEAQQVALRKRFGVPQGEELPANISTYFVCLTCRTFKGFVVKRTDRMCNLFANGHHKVTIDDDTLVCYCGRRTDQNDSKKRQRVFAFDGIEGDTFEQEEANKRARKRDWKLRRKKWLNHECFHTPCTQINLLGVLFQFYEHLYYLCPLCASPTVYDPQTFGEHGLHCGQCTRPDIQFHVECVLCGLQRGTAKWNLLTYLEDGEEKSDVMCKDCEKQVEQEGGPYELQVFRNMIQYHL